MTAPLTDTKRRPWLAFYPKDWLADTLHLTAIEHGAYLLLLCHYWVHGGLPSDEAMLQRIARLSADEWAASRGTLAAFFKSGWIHARVEREMEQAREKHEKRANAGRCGGLASGKTRARRGEAMLQQCSTNAEAKTNHPHPQYSVSKDTGETAQNAPPANAASADWRTRLFRDGLSIVRCLTGKPEQAARSLIGRWLRSVQDDARQVLRVLEDARENNPADPVAWIEGALRNRTAQRIDARAFMTARA